MTVRLEQWSVTSDPYAAPELGRVWLQGVCFGHPKMADGERITTARVASVRGRTVTTGSGTVYRLGRPAAGYLKWMRECGLKYDSKNPVKVRP